MRPLIVYGIPAVTLIVAANSGLERDDVAFALVAAMVWVLIGSLMVKKE